MFTIPAEDLEPMEWGVTALVLNLRTDQNISVDIQDLGAALPFVWRTKSVFGGSLCGGAEACYGRKGLVFMKSNKRKFPQQNRKRGL